jgi:hypothetical protein
MSAAGMLANPRFTAHALQGAARAGMPPKTGNPEENRVLNLERAVFPNLRRRRRGQSQVLTQIPIGGGRKGSELSIDTNRDNLHSLHPIARSLAVEYQGAIYHVLSRGDRRETIFRTDADRNLFRDLLGLDACIKSALSLPLIKECQYLALTAFSLHARVRA